MFGASPCFTTTSYSLRSEPVVSSQQGSLWASSTATWSAASAMTAQDGATMKWVRASRLVVSIWCRLMRTRKSIKKGNDMFKVSLILTLSLSVAACTMASPIYDKNGQPALLIACGSATPISICYDRAASECPAGYTLISEHRGFNRAEIKVRCHQALRAHDLLQD